MKFGFRLLLATILCLSLAAGAYAITGTEIVQNVHDRDNGDSAASETTMILINDKGQEKERTVRMISKDYGDLSKSMIRFLAPADVKGTGFLVWENDDRDDDQFLYLPALKQDPRRIASSEKSSRFMGTEFTYEDMENRKVEKDTHTYLRDEQLNGYTCHVVESIPKEGEESQYGKFISWVRPDIWIPIRIEFYDENMELLKILTVSEIKEIDGIWTTTESLMDNVQEGRKTILRINEIQYNLDIPDDYFTERYLKE
ncbi:MAG: outer membrane lipoprotein-sorting protein [Deltaproteobacteria bacterium]|nr:outer membrane lipoprotein-sorting protein [Candidatus Zymogenaceae bacterium]